MNVRIMSALVGLALVAPLAAALPEIGVADVSRLAEPQRWIVGFYTLPDDRSTYAGERVVAVDEDLRYMVVETRNPLGVQAHAKGDDNARYTEFDDPNWAHLLFVPNDARYNDAGHYGTKKIKAEAAWDRTLGSTSIKVGMLDTGLKKTHEDITGSRVLQGYDFYNNDNDPNDQGGFCSYHGTHTTGTAGATIHNGKGIAGLSQHLVLPVKAFGGGLCGGSTTALSNGLKYIADQGAQVSSNSWGSSASSSTFNSAIDYAHNKGTIHVAAAGNSGSCTNCVSYPWKDRPSSVIIVSSSDSGDKFSSFSSQGPQVDVIAPGSSILSMDGSGTTGYKTLSGTSMACPHVAGVAALIKALNPTFTFSNVEGRIKTTADNIGLISDRQGAGRLDAGEAVY